MLMRNFESALELLQPGQTGLCVFTDGRWFKINNDGSGSTGNWKASPRRNVDVVVIYRQEIRDGQRFVELFTGKPIGYDGPKDGRYVIELSDVRLEGSTVLPWYEFADTGQNPVRYVTRPKA